MIKNKNNLIDVIKRISDHKLKQGILYRELALSIEQRKDEKTFKEWIKFVNENSILKRELKGGLK